VIERFIAERTKGTNCFLDIDTGQILTPPPPVAAFFQQADWMQKAEHGMYPSSPDTKIWLEKTGADLCIGNSAGDIVFFGCSPAYHDQSVRPPFRFDWTFDSLPNVLKDRINEPPWLNNAKPVNSKNPLLINPKELDADTFFVNTRGGHFALLQVTGFTENPRGVKIRYKLVQSTPP